MRLQRAFYWSFWLSILTYLVAFSVPAFSAAEPGDRPATLSDRTVMLRHGEVDPYEVKSLTAELVDGTARHVLMQFGHMPDAGERQALDAAGLKVLTYLPHQTYWVSIAEGADTAAAERAAGGIYWAWVPPPEYKMDAAVSGDGFPVYSAYDDGTVAVRVLFFEDVSHATAAAALAGIAPSLEIVGWPSPRAATVRGPLRRMAELASLDEVEWVEPAPPPNVADNVTAAARIRVDEVHAAPYFLEGGGEVVGIWDGGAVFPHTDFGSRLTVVESVAVSDHSTHVAGTVGGSGAGNANAEGMAPSVDLRSYDWNDDEIEMRQAVENGIAVSNHSYGSPAGWTWQTDHWEKLSDTLFGQYTSTTQEWDDIIFDTDLLVFKSAGNDRNDCGAPGDCDGPFDCIPHRGVAKNLVTVGATDDTDGMSSFSSWGPADDGRVKPDLCANGTGLTSTLPGNTYGSKSGTSMASPSAAGAAALLRQHFIAVHGGAPPAATVKALMIHGAQDLGRTGPDYEFGWGLIDARRSAELIDADAWRHGAIAATGGSRTSRLVVGAGASELRVTLAWTDPAALPAATEALVNNLDLLLTAPNGSQHRPWILDPENRTAVAGRGTNHLDNVEQVVVDSPLAGEWRLTVSGFAVPDGPQAFTVVAEGLVEPAWGNALMFDGVDDRVEIGSAPMLSDHTLEAWIKPNPHDDRFGFVAGQSTGPSEGCTTGVGLRMAGNKACYFLEPWGCANDYSICDGELGEFGVWMHIAGTWDGTSMRFYVDGRLVGERTGVSFEPSDWMTIGAMDAMQGYEAFFSGEIDEVRVWSHARTAEQIRQSMYSYLTGTEPGLVGYWRLDEGTGQAAFDGSPVPHHGMLGTGSLKDAGDPLWIGSEVPTGDIFADGFESGTTSAWSAIVP